jgi:hypothetical protein
MNHQSIPPERDLPAGHLEARRQHLLAEAGADGRGVAIPRLPSLEAVRDRRVWLPAAAACATALVATFVALRPFENGPRQSASAAPSRPVPVSVARTGPGDTWRATAPASLVSIDVPSAVGRALHPSAEISGGTSAQQALVRTILGRMPGNLITRVEIVTTAGGQSGVTLRFTGTSSDEIRSEWEEHLVAGAFRDLSAEAGLPRVLGYPPPWPVTAAHAPDAAAALEATLRSAARSVQAEVVALTIYRPDGLAPLVVLGVPASTSPADFLRVGLPKFLSALGDRWRDYDGTFVEVVDHDQSFVWAAGTAPRASEGSVGTRPDLAGCSPVANWGPSPPPCPAR